MRVIPYCISNRSCLLSPVPSCHGFIVEALMSSLHELCHSREGTARLDYRVPLATDVAC